VAGEKGFLLCHWAYSLPESRSKSKSRYGRRSLSHSILVSSTIWGSWRDFDTVEQARFCPCATPSLKRGRTVSHYASYPVYERDSFPVVNRPEREHNFSPPPSAETYLIISGLVSKMSIALPCQVGLLSPRHGTSSDCGWMNCLQLWRVTANILNKQPRTNDKGWLSSLGVGRGVKNPSL
jgi:hypothetical protein